MKVAAFVLALVAFALAQGGTGGAEMQDGCYYLNGERFGCIKALVNACDNEWVRVRPLRAQYSHLTTLSVLPSDEPCEQDLSRLFRDH